MRLAVLDVGSNTVHLLVVDAHPGARPLPAYSHKTQLQLIDYLDSSGAVTEEGVRRLREFVTEALIVAEEQGSEDLLAFATSALREAPNGDKVLAQIRQDTNVDLQVLPGRDEARLTFLAVRRWYGWSAGRLLVVDVGGGSLELAGGIDEEPDAAVSLPLGAGRLTRDWLPGDPPDGEAVRSLRRHVRAELGRRVRPFTVDHPDRAVGTSKTVRQLARITGAAPSSDGLYVRRTLRLAELKLWLPRLAGMTVAARARLPGVSPGRAGQLVAGAVVVEAAMELLGIAELDVCPWALREGVILRRLDWMQGI